MIIPSFINLLCNTSNQSFLYRIQLYFIYNHNLYIYKAFNLLENNNNIFIIKIKNIIGQNKRVKICFIFKKIISLFLLSKLKAL